MFNKEDFDEEVRPQDDFYHYVNGGWLKNNPVPKSESRWGTFLKLREDNWKRLHVILQELCQDKGLVLGGIQRKLRDFYVSAIDPQKVEATGLPFLKLWLDKVGSIATRQDILSVIFELQKYDVSVPWANYVDVDDKLSDQYVLRFHQAGLGMPDRDYYLNEDEVAQKIRAEYELHIARMVALVGSEVDKMVVEHVMQIETALAKASMSKTEKRNIEAQYNKKTLAELKLMVPTVDWDEYHRLLGLPVLYELIIDQPKFMEAVQSLLVEIPVEVWKDYLRWQVVRSCANFLGEHFEEANFLFYGKVLSGTEELKPRWKRVVMHMDGAIGEALGQEFIKRHFPPLAKERMSAMVQDLKDAFAKRIQNLLWMSESSKQYAKEKLQKLRLKIGYPDIWRDYTSMNIGDASFIENIFEASRFELARNINKLGKPVDKGEWHMTPQTVNAYANFNMNEIVFPAGILQFPFFDVESDDAENYGGIGYVIGHEITHGFDDIGSQFDADGNLRNWKTEEDKNNFEKLAKMLEEQANSFEVLPGLNLNGKLTLGENIGDLGGLEIALDAFEQSLLRSPLSDIDGFTPVQRFFLSHARSEAENERDEEVRKRVLTDPHSPAIFRSNGVLKNVDRFYEAFKVGLIDKMYVPFEERVKIW